MKTLFLTAVVVCGAAFFVYHFRGELLIADPIDSLIHGQPEQDFEWPPKLNEPYPDLHLVDQTGSPTRLSDYKGKVILVEPIGIPCPACQAFCGGNMVGGFQGVQPQPGLPSIQASAQQVRPSSYTANGRSRSNIGDRCVGSYRVGLIR